MLAMPWKSIVIAGESIFNMSNAIIDKPTSTFVAIKSPAIDVESTLIKTIVSVTVIGTDGLDAQLDEVFTSGIRHKGERKRKESTITRVERSNATASAEKTMNY